MSSFWYAVVSRSADFFGTWLFTAASRSIAAGYFLFSWKRVAQSRNFYAALFPDRGRVYHLYCTFRQFQNFTTIHFDRFLKERNKEVTFSSMGLEKLDEVVGRQGGILLMSHLGNWEMAADLLKKQRQDLQLLLYMGVKEKEGVERLQKEELRRSGITIIGVDREDNAAFSSVAGIQFLRSGGLVSMAGDIVWRKDQRKVVVSFLGHDAYLPEAPFVFSLVSGAPLFAFFAFRTGKNSYIFSLSEPIVITAHSRSDRRSAISRAAQQYADLLEKSLRQHPFEWYHFNRFIY
ncbi:MAG: lysophospholipid acyltransferase family protein [Desulfopila sp.]|jgi:predicted LPLAT superfamily acyltransferase|nr:lysophospholipid acyltransferase family protein [Desulfopila sp.]